MLKILLIGIAGGAVGLVSGQLGYGIDTWQYWAFAMPICFGIGVFGYKALTALEG